MKKIKKLTAAMICLTVAMTGCKNEAYNGGGFIIPLLLAAATVAFGLQWKKGDGYKYATGVSLLSLIGCLIWMHSQK